MNKVVNNIEEAIKDIKDGMTLMFGGFGLYWFGFISGILFLRKRMAGFLVDENEQLREKLKAKGYGW